MSNSRFPTERANYALLRYDSSTEGGGVKKVEGMNEIMEQSSSFDGVSNALRKDYYD